MDADLPGKDIEFTEPPESTSEWGKITGTLRHNGFPANGSNVLLFEYAPEWSGWMQLPGVVADDDGTFMFDEVRAGRTYTLQVKVSGGGNQYVYYGGQTSGSDEPGTLPATNLNSFVVRKGQTFDAGEMNLTADGVPFRSAETPAITGRAAVGSKLTATTNTSLWDPTYPTLTYRWLRNGAPIPNATASTYVLSAADLGANISVRVTATAPWGGETYLPARVFSAETAPVAPGTLTAPTPTVTGTAAVGRALSASAAGWTPGTALTYQWYRGSSPISGARSRTYVPAASDLGKTFAVRVTGKKAGYNTVSKMSRATRPAVAGKFSAAPTPKITGKAKVGKTLKVSTKAWKPSGTKLKYQWFANGKKIAKATKAKYKVSAKMRGKKISVTVTGSKRGYQNLTKKSKATKGVQS